MENDLISRSDLRQRVEQTFALEALHGRNDYMLSSVLTAIETAPTIDPDSLRERGRWERDPDSPPRHKCSKCGSNPYDNEADQLRFNADFKEYLTKYCPDCGARMDLEG